MVGAFQRFLNQTKDVGTSIVFERWLARQIEPYGRMLNLTLDSQRKTLRLEVLPKGETQPVVIQIEQYELVQEGSETYLIFRKATASREWIQTLVQQFGLNRKIPIPQQYANLIRLAV